MKPLLPASLGVALLLTGCKVQTTYQKPKLEIPAKFSQGSTTEAKGLESNAWWKAFGDPTLDTLLSRAIQGSLSIQQAQARVLQARATLGSAKADQWPAVNATASGTRSNTSDNAYGYATPTTSLYQAGFDATWELDLFGGKRKAREAAQARLEASVEDLGDVILTLQGDVATNYIALRSNQALLEITRQNAESQRQTAEVTEERYRLGLTSYLDVAQAKAQLSTTSSEIPSLEASVKQSIHRLGILLGQEPTALAGELSQSSALPSAQGLIATGLPSELLSRRPDLRKAERNLAAAMADVGVAKADLYPKFDLTLGLGLQSLQASSFTKAASRYWSIVPGISLPIFNRGQVKAEVAQKQAVYEEKLAAFQASYHTALEDVENALTSYYAEKGRHQSLEDSLRHNQEALSLAQERYRRGLTSFLDVLTAQTSLHTAQSSLSQSKARLLTDMVALYKALGGGWKAV
ncbi:efflux transporter outer membrane subunit [Holophaga foetida]|uniref:efflux transporter outer membrane subunit n=1 Tax=Holophaga foetida TaxID=35839 RepID=UPI000247460D|nr:efflux transporter outer membrane subunit [Holophaga foetida]